jgi:hypothetical protein
MRNFKEVSQSDIQDGQSYFLARKIKTSIWFWSQPKNGPEKWTSKPGIAVHFVGGDDLRKVFDKNRQVEMVAIEVPSDHAKRWRARK